LAKTDLHIYGRLKPLYRDNKIGVAIWRAVVPSYTNNKDKGYENKIKNKKYENDIQTCENRIEKKKRMNATEE